MLGKKITESPLHCPWVLPWVLFSRSQGNVAIPGTHFSGSYRSYVVVTPKTYFILTMGPVLPPGVIPFGSGPSKIGHFSSNVGVGGLFVFAINGLCFYPGLDR